MTDPTPEELPESSLPEQLPPSLAVGGYIKQPGPLVGEKSDHEERVISLGGRKAPGIAAQTTVINVHNPTNSERVSLNELVSAVEHAHGSKSYPAVHLDLKAVLGQQAATQRNTVALDAGLLDVEVRVGPVDADGYRSLEILLTSEDRSA